MDVDNPVIVDPADTPAPEVENPTEELQEYAWHGKTIKANAETIEALRRQDKEFTTWQQERAAGSKKSEESPKGEEETTLTPEEEQKQKALQVIEDALRQKGYMRREDFEAEQQRLKGQEALDRMIDDTLKGVDQKAKEFGDDKVKPNDEELARIKDLVHNHGLHPEEAYMAIKGYEMNQASVLHGQSFTPKNLNTAPAKVQGKTQSEEDASLKPISSGKTVKDQYQILAENSRKWRMSQGIPENFSNQ